jgi:hypothetical protein
VSREERMSGSFSMPKGCADKNFVEHGRNILGVFRHFAVYMVFIVVFNEHITIWENQKSANNLKNSLAVTNIFLDYEP